MPGLPMSCHRCGLTFEGRGFINPGGGSVEVINSTFSTNCPRCGAEVRRTGSFEVTERGWRSLASALAAPEVSRADLARLAEIVQTARGTRQSATDVASTIQRELPSLRRVADFLQSERGDRLALWLTVLFTVLMYFKPPPLTADPGPGATTNVTVEVVQPSEQQLQEWIQQALVAAENEQQDRVEPTRARPQRSPARNRPCPCGSGIKYKKCHGAPQR